jgi:hypothetical protein
MVALAAEEITEKEHKVSRSEVSRVMAEMGRKGGKIGGRKRADNMTEKERSNAAAQAARARWAAVKAQQQQS